MNLRKGNVFTAVCLSFCSCCIGPPCTEFPGFVPLSYLQTWDVIVHRSPPLPPWWHRAVITGDLFKLIHFRTPSPCCWHLVAIETWTVSASRWLHPSGMFPCILRLSEFCFTMHDVQEFLTVLRSKKILIKDYNEGQLENIFTHWIFQVYWNTHNSCGQ